MVETSKGKSLFRVQWAAWQLLGIPNGENVPGWFYLYSISINVFFLILYPLHLLLGVLQSADQYECFKNMAICLPVMVCCLKFYIFWWHMDEMRELEMLLEQCEQAIVSNDEMEYYKNVTIPSARRVLDIFYFACIGASVTSAFVFLVLGVFTGNWQLIYPAYFPFDEQKSVLNYIVAIMYQLIGEVIMCVVNFNNDTYGVVNIALLNGHVHMLGMRVLRIGHNADRSQDENNEELAECIQQYQILLAYYNLLQKIISLFTLIQLAITCVTLCIVIVFIIYFIDNIVLYVYYAVFLFGITMEIFPMCHHGSLFEFEMGNLPNCIFESNWMDQNKEFKQNLRIFVEQTLKKRTFKAGKTLGINYATFLGTCKTAYSLFAVIIQTK